MSHPCPNCGTELHDAHPREIAAPGRRHNEADCVHVLKAERDAAVALVRDILGLEFTRPLSDVLDQLRAATVHLLQDHSCDCHGHEQLNAALDRLPMYRASLDKAAQWLHR